MVYQQLKQSVTFDTRAHGAANNAPMPVKSCDPSKIAVLLNRNARRVNDALAKAMANIVGRDHVYYSHSIEQAEVYAREIVSHGYGTVVCGGGDGTLMQAYNLVARHVQRSNAWRQERFRRFGEKQALLPIPRFAFLALGTGNAMRRVVGAQDPLADLKYLVEHSVAKTQEVALIACGDERFTFGGLGYDSLLLNDYNWLKTHANSQVLKPLVQSLPGYFAALFTRTMPRVLLGGVQLHGRVRAVGASYYLDPRRGDVAVALPTDAILHDGPFTMVGFGTTPFFGYGMRVFPFAGLHRDKMNLRIAKLGAFGTLSNLPAIWQGTYRDHDKMLDFQVKEIVVELHTPHPLQVAGDDRGMIDHLHLRIAPDRLQLVDLYAG